MCLLSEAQSRECGALLSCLAALREEASEKTRNLETFLREVGTNEDSVGTPIEEDSTLAIRTDSTVSSMMSSMAIHS